MKEIFPGKDSDRVHAITNFSAGKKFFKKSQYRMIEVNKTFHSGMIFLILNARKTRCDLHGLLDLHLVDSFIHLTCLECLHHIKS